MNGKVTYHQQVSYCGKPRCRKCREGTGHGPYWYAYQTVDGRTTRTYIGKHLPLDVQASMEGSQESQPAHASELEQACVRIYVLGQFRLERRHGRNTSEWQTVTDSAWQHQRVRALLACLVSSSGRKLGREQIMDALWPDLDIETAGSRLDRAVYSLRQLFEPNRGRLATSPLLLTEREVLVLADQSQIWIDADAFEQLLAQAHASADPGEKEQLFEEAATLYGGDFLPEERKVEWTLARRESLQRSWIGMLLNLADLRITREALTNAIEPLDRLLSIDPTNEAAVQRLILLLGQLGRRGEALRAYKRLATILQQEYHIAPLPETRALYDAVRRGAQSRETTLTVESQISTQAVQRDIRPDAPATIQIGRNNQSPLVGREQELDFLRGLVASTEHASKFKLPGQKKTSVATLDTQRRSQCILLMGEVGIGKTRLAEEVSRDAKKRGWAVAWSRVYAQEGSIPYRLWTEVLRKAMAQGAWQRQEVSKRPLVFQPLCALLPELHSLLPQVAFSSSLPPEQEQLRLWEAARELLTIISEGSPLLIALDDLQWADRSSCELFAYLARRMQNHPIIIVGTCRDNELGPDHPLRPLLTDLQREHVVEVVALQPLSDEQISALVSSVPHLPEPMVQRIRNRAAGNPFFAEELARSIGSQAFSSNLDNGSDPVHNLPDTITAVLDLRLGRLSGPCQRLLSKAAVLGGSFEFNLISTMEGNAQDFDEDTVLDLLEEALKSGMLTEEGTGTRITYQFWHPLLVSHLYEKLSAARRASLHRRAADILQSLYRSREAEGAAKITHHLVQGGANSQQIAHYAELAGNQAYEVSAYPDAERYYRLALEHLDTANTDKHLHMAYLLELLGECTIIQGKFEEAQHFYEQALEVRRQQSNSVSQQEAQLRSMLWCEVGWTWYNMGDMGQARKYCEISEQVLQEAGVVAGSAWARLYFQQSYVNWREGSYEDAQRTALKALRLFDETLKSQNNALEHITLSTRIRRTLAGDPVDLGRTQMLLGNIETSSGHCRNALTHFNMALALYEQYDRQREIAIVCCNLGDLHLRQAEYPQAQAVLRRSLSLAERIGELPLISFVFGNLGVLGLRTGDLVEAEAEFMQCIALAERSNNPADKSVFCTYLATTLQEQGKLSEAGAMLRRAFEIGRAMRITPYISLALIALGSLRATQAIAADISEESKTHRHDEITRTLKRAKKTLLHALALEGMEAETKTEGQLTLAQVMLSLGEIESARQLATRTLEEAHQFELTWLIARAQRILGSILVAQGQYIQANQYFEQALRTFRKHHMNLEYARTLQHYGTFLLETKHIGDRDYQRGIGSLREALQVFKDRKAALDIQTVERVLASCGQTTSK